MSPKHPIPDTALDDRLGFVGTAGSGKTYGAGTALERVLSRGSRAIVVDPLGVWWGLRLLADGVTPSPFDAVIFGGPHGDLAINEHAGAIIGETVAGMKESAILDLSGLGTKAAERRFMLGFLTALYRAQKARPNPLHLVFDEADMWAPQVIRDRDQEPAKLLGMMETIVRRGRVAGFIPWLITQRPAVVNKDVLSQVDGLIAFKLTASQDRKALGDWIEGQADREQGKAILASLPAMDRGKAVVWVPARGVLTTEQFPAKATFDSSRTPARGEKVKAATLKALDLGALRDRLTTVEAEAKANDPRVLKAEIVTLRRQMAEAAASAAKSGRAIDPKAIAEAEERGYQRAFEKGHTALMAYWAELEEVRAELSAAMDGFRSLQDKFVEASGPGAVFQERPNRPKPAPVARPAPQPKPKTAPIRQPTGTLSLPPGERAVLIAAAQFAGVARDQLTVLTGYKRSTRDAYIQRLREKGFVAIDGQTITATEDGWAALPPDYDPLPVGADLQSYWLARLPDGERRILQELIAAYPDSVQRADLDAATGFKRSTRDAYLQRMKAKRLWTADGSAVRAAEELFG